ncbi:MAG: hypothetical protein ACK4E3_11715 [Brevundimonas sp.]|uniref:F0F1 ATP synthase subunit B family protein n=1 Tax=Brevundimonas sp. TaxID=1871086 RepID=UPI00391891A9
MAEPTLSDPATLPPQGAGVQEMTTAPEVHGDEGGLPQFDTQHYFGQIAYLLILFVILYVLISKVFAPRLRRVMDERASTISGAIATARQVQEEAAVQAASARAEVERARADARAVAAAAKARILDDMALRNAEEEAAVNARIEAAEADIALARDTALSSVGDVAAETAQAMIKRLTGESVPLAELRTAAKGAA